MTSRNHEENQSTTMLEEGELRAMFAPRRPDAAQFSAGIAQRLAAAAAANSADAADDSQQSDQQRDSVQQTDSDQQTDRVQQTDRDQQTASHQQSDKKQANQARGPHRDGDASTSQRSLGRQAASILPGVPAGGASGKSLLTTLGMPFVLLVGAIVAFGRGLRGVDPATYRDQPKPSDRATKNNTSFLTLLPAIGSLLGIAAMATFWIAGSNAATHLVTLGLIVGMLIMTWHIGQTARSGVASSVQIGRAIILLLLAAVFGCWAWLGSVIIFDGDSLFGHSGVGWVLWLGTVCACLLVAQQSRHLDPGIGMFLFLVLPLLGATSLELPSDTKGRVRSHLNSLWLSPENLTYWSSAQVLGHALEATGEQLPAMPEVRKRVAAAVVAEAELPSRPWSAEVRAQVSVKESTVHPQVWSTAARLGLLDREQLALLATTDFTPARLNNLLERNGPLSHAPSNDYLLDCLLASRELTGQEREHLVQRIDASWPQPGQQIDALGQAKLLAGWLDRLGRRDMVLRRRDELHDLLIRHWITEARAQSLTRPGGFTTYPQHDWSDIRATGDAIALMEFVGAPDELQLNHVRAFLRHSYRTSLLGRMITGKSVLGQQAEASLLLLNEGIRIPDRGWLAFLIGERTMLAALLLVLLGLRAIRLAHVSEHKLVGAMP